MAEWIQGATGMWVMVDGDVRIKGPQLEPDDDGLSRTASVQYADAANGSLQRALELLGQIESDPARAANGRGGPGLPGMALLGDWAQQLRNMLGPWWWLILAALAAAIVIASDD